MQLRQANEGGVSCGGGWGSLPLAMTLCCCGRVMSRAPAGRPPPAGDLCPCACHFTSLYGVGG